MPRSWVDEMLGNEAPSAEFVSGLRQRLSDTWNGTTAPLDPRERPRRWWQLSFAAAAAALLVVALAVTVRDDSSTPGRLNPDDPNAPLSTTPTDATPSVPSTTVDGTVGPSCRATNPPEPGECAFVDWDLIAADDLTLTIEAYLNAPGCAESIDRIDLTETEADVELSAVAHYSGDDGVSCPTTLGSTITTVQLSAPVGQRSLSGCRPQGTFAPAGGYNDPAPRGLVDCRYTLDIDVEGKIRTALSSLDIRSTTGDHSSLGSATMRALDDQGNDTGLYISGAALLMDNSEFTVLGERTINGVIVRKIKYTPGRTIDSFVCDGVDYRPEGVAPPRFQDFDDFLGEFIDALGCSPTDSAPSATNLPDVEPDGIARCSDPPFLGGPSVASPPVGGVVNRIVGRHSDLFAGVWWDSRAEQFAFAAVDSAQATTILQSELPADIAHRVEIVSRSAKQLDEIQQRAGGLSSYGIEAGSGQRPWDGTVGIDLPILDDASLQAVRDVFGTDVDAVCVSGADPAIVPPEGPQPASGDGWRLLADQTQRGEAYTVHVAVNAAEYETLWASLGLTGPPPAVDFDAQIVIHFGAVYGSSCPEIRLDGITFDLGESVVSADIVQLGGARGCTLDANPRAYLVAVDKQHLPELPFRVTPYADPCTPCTDVEVTSLIGDPSPTTSLTVFDRWRILGAAAERRVEVDNSFGVEDVFDTVDVVNGLGRADAAGHVRFDGDVTPLTKSERNAIRQALGPREVRLIDATEARPPTGRGTAILSLAEPTVVDGQLTITTQILCGDLCGIGSAYILQRGDDGTWTIDGTSMPMWES